MPRTGRSGKAYGSVPRSARALWSVSGGPVTAYGPTMRVTVGAGVGGGPADGCTSRAARSDATSSAGWSFTADLRSVATVVGAAAADRRRCIGRGVGTAGWRDPGARRVRAAHPPAR